MTMNKQFTNEQIMAYASQFRIGDAIYVNDNWYEVDTVDTVYQVDNRLLVDLKGISWAINLGESRSYEGVDKGFEDTQSSPYRVTTLEHYKAQGGEKIVWLGGNYGGRTFGEVYHLFVDVHGELAYTNDNGYNTSPVYTLSSEWGVIPHYEQIKNNETTISEPEYFNIKELLKNSIDLIPNTDELLFERLEILNTTKELLNHIGENIIQRKYKSKAEIQFETTLVPHKANGVKNIVVDILKNKGYKVESTIKTEQEEGFSSVEYISTIELVVSW